MTYLVKATSHNRALKVHQANANGAPVCGGGNGRGRQGWQEDIGPANCVRCQQIIERRTHENRNHV